MIIQSLLDNDVYTASVGQIAHKYFPQTEVEYRFIDRKPRHEWTFEKLDRLLEEIDHLSTLKFSPEELRYLSVLGYLSPAYLEWLSAYQFDPGELFLSMSNNQLNVKISGDWVRTIWWEVPLLSLVSQIQFEDRPQRLEEHRENSLQKLTQLQNNNIKFMEFGTRRRRSFEHQRIVCELAQEFPNCVGTSNLYLAKKYGLKAFGTLSHQLPMAMSSLYSVESANRQTMNVWRKEYKNQLSCFLTDTYTVDNFWKNFTREDALQWKAVRQDSGDPFLFGEKFIREMHKRDLFPEDKTIVFSDSLTVDKCMQLQERFAGSFTPLFGIGTHFSNPFPDALSIVIKLWQVNGKAVAKLSDDIEKATGETEAIRRAKLAIGTE